MSLRCSVALSFVLSFGLVGCLGAESPASGTTSGGDATSTKDTAATDTATKTAPPFVDTCKTDADCTKASCVLGVCVPMADPAKEVAVLTDPTNDNVPTTDPLQLGCVGESVEDAVKSLPTGGKAVMWGRVDRFGGGGVTTDIEVAVFKFSDFHPEACYGLTDDAAIQACYLDDSKVGKPLAKTISISAKIDSAKAAGLDLVGKASQGDDCIQHLDCGAGYECRYEKSVARKICIETHGIYALPDVPTNVQLIVRVHPTKPTSSKWHDGYLWDIVLFSDRLDQKGDGLQPSKYVNQDTYRVNPTIVGEAQWQLVPTTMGLQEIDTGNGVIGGRIRDCGVASGRGGWAIHNAKIGLGVKAQGIAFFNDSEDDTVPVKTSAATDLLGRYAAVDIPPGPNRLSATVLTGGKTVQLGAMDVYVIPNSLTICSLPGRVPVLTK